MVFFEGEALMFTKFFRGTDPYSSRVSPYCMEVFRGKCNFSLSSEYVLNRGVGGWGGGEVRILNAIGHSVSSAPFYIIGKNVLN